MDGFTCTECNEDFEAEGPFGDDVQCPHCKIWLSVDSEHDTDNSYFWVTGISDDQTQVQPEAYAWPITNRSAA